MSHLDRVNCYASTVKVVHHTLDGLLCFYCAKLTRLAGDCDLQAPTLPYKR